MAIFVHHDHVASVIILVPNYVYSDNRGRHRHLLPPADWRRNRRRVLLCWSLRHGVQLVLVPVYACPVLATPTRAFIHDVSPGLANLVRRLVNTD